MTASEEDFLQEEEEYEENVLDELNAADAPRDGSFTKSLDEELGPNKSPSVHDGNTECN